MGSQGQYNIIEKFKIEKRGKKRSPLPVAECRLSKLQYLDSTPLMPPPPHTTPLLSESEPGESPELPLLLLQFSALCAPLDSLGHCWVLMRPAELGSRGLGGAAAALEQRSAGLSRAGRTWQRRRSSALQPEQPLGSPRCILTS